MSLFHCEVPIALSWLCQGPIVTTNSCEVSGSQQIFSFTEPWHLIWAYASKLWMMWKKAQGVVLVYWQDLEKLVLTSYQKSFSFLNTVFCVFWNFKGFKKIFIQICLIKYFFVTPCCRKEWIRLVVFLDRHLGGAVLWIGEDHFRTRAD